MERIIQYKITESQTGSSVKGYLKAKGYSARSLIELKKQPENVLRNGAPVFMNGLLCDGDTLTIRILETESSEKIPPVQLPLSILYEDADLLVINKPAGMPIHPSMGNYENSLANALAWYYQQKNCPFVFRCANRSGPRTPPVLP